MAKTLMSYARFSSDDWRSDVYVYKSNNGFQVHLASNRIPLDYDALPPFISFPKKDEPNHEEKSQAFFTRHRLLLNMLEDNNHLRRPIDLPHAGESFVYETPGECADALMELQVLGYVIPKHTITDLQKEEDERIHQQQNTTRNNERIRPAQKEG